MDTMKIDKRNVLPCFLGVIDSEKIVSVIQSLKKSYDVLGIVLDKEQNLVLETDIVLFGIHELTKEFINHNNVDELLLIPIENTGMNLFKTINSFLIFELKLSISPFWEKWYQEKFDAKSIKKLEIDDLLIRNNSLEEKIVSSDELRGETILITGAAGSIGSELSRQISKYDCGKIILLDQSESLLYDLEQEFLSIGFTQFEIVLCDIRNKDRLQVVFKEFRPSIIYHAAAYKHVPLMEKQPDEAVAVNINGTKNIADLSMKFNVEKLIFISTDKAISPVSIMGKTKKIAEAYLLSLNNSDEKSCKFIITRFGNVLSSSGSVIPLFKKQIKKGGPITLTDKEVTRYFMSINEACALVIQSSLIGKGGEVFSFDMGESIRIYEIAKRMIELEKIHSLDKRDIKIIGLRPGEKLHEEPMFDQGNFKDTVHDKIKKCKPILYKCEELEGSVIELCATRDVTKIKEKLNRILKEISS